MRIVAGRLKGRRIAAPAGRAVRPTSDRAREALFNRLVHGGFGPGGASILAGVAVLDAFCGTGALGLEALSRGAECATFVDNDARSLNAARANAGSLGVEDACVFVAADAAAPPPAPRAHALAFLDLPYADETANGALAALAGKGWLEAGALCAVETGAAAEPAAPPPGFEAIDARRYGAARIALLRYAAAA